MLKLKAYGLLEGVPRRTGGHWVFDTVLAGLILGIGMVALPACMLTSRFSEVMHRQQDLFRRFVEESIETNGHLSEDLVEQRRQELYIRRAEANSVITNCIDESKQALNLCPSCGSKLPRQKRA